MKQNLCDFSKLHRFYKFVKRKNKVNFHSYVGTGDKEKPHSIKGKVHEKKIKTN